LSASYRSGKVGLSASKPVDTWTDYSSQNSDIVEQAFTKCLKENKESEFQITENGIRVTVFIQNLKLSGNFHRDQYNPTTNVEIRRVTIVKPDSESKTSDVDKLKLSTAKQDGSEKKEYSECQVCYAEFDNSDCIALTMHNCGHRMLCRDCFKQYISIKVKDLDVLPYVRCPDSNGCKIPICSLDLATAQLDTLTLFRLAAAHMTKSITRNPDWVSCSTKGCPFGFMVRGASGTSLGKKSCGLCSKQQEVKKEEVKLSDDFIAMIKSGKVRQCPKCPEYVMKDYGMCNAINCQRCGVWWNWRSKETAPDYETIKQMARNAGSLWEPGELEFQQNLQSRDPVAFAALLAKNGIKYDPSYQRGT
jgi:CRISPR/Cas system CSM-associated protein Csm2 small subunit